MDEQKKLSLDPKNRRSLPYRLKHLLYDNLESQAEFAAAIGVRPGAVNNWLKGNNGMKADELIATSEHFGVPVGYLLGTEDSKVLDLDIRSISKYTGLSDESVEVLEYLNQTPTSDPTNEDNKKILSFINRALKAVYIDVRFAKEIIESNPDNKAFVSMQNAVFVHLEDYVTGSGGSGVFSFANGKLNEDQVFRYVALENIKNILGSLADENGTPLHPEQSYAKDYVKIKPTENNHTEEE